MGHRRRRHAGADLAGLPRGRRSRTAPARACSTATASYEISTDPYFSVARLSLLDRGFVYAIAHVRGGGEMGRRWYDDGKTADQEEHLHRLRRLRRPPRRDAAGSRRTGLSAEGGSAGGLLIGAVVNLAPERFRAVHAAVPFVDALTTILDPTLPLTVREWEEWGDPLHDPEVYAYMKSYTPYENVTARGSTRRSWRPPA